jgi:hypothetical protein
MKTPIQELMQLESDLTHMFDSDKRVAMAILEHIRNNKKEILEKEKENNMTEKYNGYTNYATWRVNLEIVEQIDIEFAVEENLRYDADMVKEWVEFAVFGDESKGDFMSSYARAFLNEVNYHELANNLNEEIEERIKYNTNSDR